VDRGLDHSGIAAQAAPVFDLVLLCMRDEHPVDTLEGFGTYLLEVALQRRLLGRLVGESDETERAVNLGVGQVERELLVAEPVCLLDHQRT
jgi:hypothetical protein